MVLLLALIHLELPGGTVISSRTGRPFAEYQQRLLQREATRAALIPRERLVGLGRLVVFAAILGLAWLAFGRDAFSGWWLVVPAAVFVALLFLHERVRRQALRAERACDFYRRGLGRLEDRWSGTGQPGERFINHEHPYSSDLDLFGKGSLFELLCTARTRTGEDTLAGWLLHPANPAEVRARQGAVQEFAPRLDLREDLALLGSEVPVGVDFTTLVQWGVAPPILVSTPLRIAAFLLGCAGFLTLGGWFFYDWPLFLFLSVALIEGTLALALRVKVQRVILTVERRARDLILLAGVLARLEEEQFASPRLQTLRQQLERDGDLPSQRIAQLCNLIDMLQSRRNQLFAPLALVLMWTTQVAFAIERWRLRSGPAIAGWLAVVGECEALCALATYSYENPQDCFPTLVEESPCFAGVELGHPLLPLAKCIRNDLTLNSSRQLVLVSGSNMSGKSTMLRTVGINAVLALAGAPVRASSLTISQLRIGSTLRIQDSLQEGRSRFYAELLRVRQVVELSRGQPPLLFLLDEIFHGTNSHDRREGAEAVVANLVKAGAVGMVTTHDLTLTHIAEVLGERAVNVHFADHLENGTMVFDYRMQPGIVRHSNALALMRSVGLEV